MSRKRRRRPSTNHDHKQPQGSSDKTSPHSFAKVEMVTGPKAVLRNEPLAVLFTEVEKKQQSSVRKRSPWWKRIFMLPSSQLHG